MKNLILFSISIAALLILTSSCKNSHNEQDQMQQQQINPEKLKEQLVKVNKAQVYSEDDQIEDFLKRYKYPVTTTASGLRYYIYKTNKDIKPNSTTLSKLPTESTCLMALFVIHLTVPVIWFFKSAKLTFLLVYKKEFY